MTEDLTELDPEVFFRLAIRRGGLDLDEAVEDLSPEVAKALRLIAAAMTGPPPPEPVRGMEQPAATRGPVRLAWQGTESEPAPKPHELRCPACGRFAPHPGDRFCRQCGHRLREAATTVTLGDLVAEGRLTAEQADKAKRTILDFQKNYPAGTRYSVFGGPW